jgi:hypothetical protein
VMKPRRSSKHVEMSATGRARFDRASMAAETMWVSAFAHCFELPRQRHARVMSVLHPYTTGIR